MKALIIDVVGLWIERRLALAIREVEHLEFNIEPKVADRFETNRLQQGNVGAQDAQSPLTMNGGGRLSSTIPGHNSGISSRIHEPARYFEESAASNESDSRCPRALPSPSRATLCAPARLPAL